jgi:cytochrome bd-type quinol oxidase subunit 1
MAEPAHLVARATPGASVNDTPFNTSYVNFLMIGIPIIVGAILTTCVGLYVWNRRKMRRKRAQEVVVAMQPLPYEAAHDGVSMKT